MVSKLRVTPLELLHVEGIVTKYFLAYAKRPDWLAFLCLCLVSAAIESDQNDDS